VPRACRCAWAATWISIRHQEAISKSIKPLNCTYHNHKFSCPDCDWILCQKDCPGIHTDHGHSLRECKSFKQHNLAAFLTRCDEKDIRFIYESILTVRCLLLKRNDPEKWRQLNEMEAHNKIRRNIPSLWMRNQELVVDRVRRQWGYDEFTEDEVHTVRNPKTN